MSKEIKEGLARNQVQWGMTPAGKSEIPPWYGKPPRQPSFFQRIYQQMGDSLSKVFRGTESPALDLTKVERKAIARNWPQGPGIPKEPK